MDLYIIFGSVVAVFLAVVITYVFTKRKANLQLREFKSISEALAIQKNNLESVLTDLKKAQTSYEAIDAETKTLQELKLSADNIELELSKSISDLNLVEDKKSQILIEVEKQQAALHDLMSKIDMYSRINDFVEVGHYETPEYLFETSARFTEEIKRIREKQKQFIKDNKAVTCEANIVVGSSNVNGKKIVDGQIKLILTAFNIEVDSLIAKVSPSNFPKILERIEKLANTLEKSAISLHCGFNIHYIELKYEECRLQYQFRLKKQEELEEQRLIKEQIREEQRAIKEFEKAIAEAEKEEKLYRSLLDKARKQLDNTNEEERLIAQQRIEELEAQLAEAEAKEQRAKSMAEQTRKGHVYVISNVGSFGENVYKIGLTRRLEPMDRVKELGDASVPFSFDVHAMIYVEDAPALESALHKEFTNKRVNAVNLRKEFFRTDLASIEDAVNRLAGIEAEFKKTIAAEEYFESKRLQVA